jgi:hypothetical protein
VIGVDKLPKHEHIRRGRELKAARWVAWLSETASIAAYGDSVRAWREYVQWVAGLGDTAWARLSSAARINPPSPETRRVIIAKLGDAGMRAAHGVRAA